VLEVGRVEKAHGLRGDVVVKLTTNVAERVAPGTELWADGRKLVVVASRPHQHRWIVQFEGMVDRAQVDALHGAVLEAEPIDDDDPETLWIHELFGRTVIDQHGTTLGTVASVIDNPASDLLELEGGGLIPLNFVTDHADPATLVVDIPIGLLDDDLRG